MPERRRGRRVRYSPEEVVLAILHKPLYFTIARILFESDHPLHATEISRIIEKQTGEKVNPGYVYLILEKFEQWGVATPERDPVNGRLMFRPSDRKVAELLRQEIMKREAKEIEELIEVDAET